MSPRNVLAKVLVDAHLNYDPKLVDYLAPHFEPAKQWYESGLKISADRRTVFFTLVESRRSGIKENPSNYTVEILMNDEDIGSGSC